MTNKITPQKGFQEDFLSSPADIVIGGGSAGAGKSFAILLEAIRHYDNPLWGAVIFRRTYAQIKNEGGLWDDSKKIYSEMGAKSNETDLSWKFEKGSSVSFSHLQYEKDIYTHQGAQYPLIIFDELTHFTASQFWYLISRNRSTSGIKPKIRGTCNPDPDSFVANLIEWWIDQETGFPIKERAGKIRYFIKDGNNIIWGDSRKEVADKVPHILGKDEFKAFELKDLIKSFTFIPGSVYENKKLLKVDPSYLANLLSQDDDVKARLLEGNWKIRFDTLGLFDYKAINDLFTNYPENQNKETYITCDAARFGRDFATIFVWRGWEVLKIVVLRQSEANDIVRVIEEERRKYRVMQSNVLVDQDGVGGGTVRLGGYEGFSGGAQPMEDPDSMIKENYKNLKTQCYYKLAEDNVNVGNIRINVDTETVVIDGLYTTKLKIGSEVKDIRDLIKEDLKAVKRKDPDNEGKKQINSKEEQKNILGRSPDFGDNIMMRKAFDLIPKRRFIKVY